MRVLSISAILAIAWLLMIAEVYVFFHVILEYAPPIHELGSLTALGLLKVGSTLGLGLLWYLVMDFVTELYVSSKLSRPPPTPSS
jgi:hypothetical protein